MPAQNLRCCPRERRPGWPSLKTLLARLVTFGGALALTVYATREMIAVVSVGGISALQWAMVVLFAITFGWISIAAAAAASGVFFGGVRLRGREGQAVEHRTALVMPIYNENPATSFAALEAMAECLLQQDAKGFELFVLSDTNNPDTWVKETAAFHALREAVGDGMRVWYRRRSDNTGRKVGNLHDFVTRWDGRYDFMIVLDADSILSAETLLLMVREMVADPDLGLLQTVPRLAGGKTLYARLQQFAGRVYGPIVARGIASWQGDDGNYWGHNAIVRVRAFASSAGLPTLQGRKPFGGAILSHDFVEAALLRRAGWAVRMLPTVDGTWEDSPPSLLDAAARDLLHRVLLVAELAAVEGLDLHRALRLLGDLRDDPLDLQRPRRLRRAVRGQPQRHRPVLGGRGNRRAQQQGERAGHRRAAQVGDRLHLVVSFAVAGRRRSPVRTDRRAIGCVQSSTRR